MAPAASGVGDRGNDNAVMPEGNAPEVELDEATPAGAGAGGTAEVRGDTVVPAAAEARAAAAEALSDGDMEPGATLLPEFRFAAESGALGNPRKSAGWIGMDTDR